MLKGWVLSLVKSVDIDLTSTGKSVLELSYMNNLGLSWLHGEKWAVTHISSKRKTCSYNNNNNNNKLLLTWCIDGLFCGRMNANSPLKCSIHLPSKPHFHLSVVPNNLPKIVITSSGFAGTWFLDWFFQRTLLMLMHTL